MADTAIYSLGKTLTFNNERERGPEVCFAQPLCDDKFESQIGEALVASTPEELADLVRERVLLLGSHSRFEHRVFMPADGDRIRHKCPTTIW